MSRPNDLFDIYNILYVNKGTDQFIESTTTILQQTFTGNNAKADLDNNGDQDIVIIGTQDGG